MLKSICMTTFLILTLLSVGFSQSQQKIHVSKNSSNAATSDCQSTFTSGNGPTFMEFCVTQNGNVTEFQSPVGVEHIREGGIVEGYGICDFTNLTRYFDWADGGDSGNWLNAVRTQPHGANTFPLKITRTTSDGIFTLTQTFTQNTAERTVKIAMSLKNNTAIPRDFALVRDADIDANNANDGTFMNTFDFDRESAWGYNAGFNLYGLMLGTIPTNLGEFAFVQSVSDPADPCEPINALAPTPFNGDGSVGIDWNGTVPAGKSVTFAGEYKRF